ncbi:hypothetical protein [Thioflexithrix psekupsensis]|nr:hypothetical protein [Thioflexithrix psekupsensis]
MNGIMQVDLAFHLFMALTLYHELSEMPKTGKLDQDIKLHQELILAIQDVVKELRIEQEKYQQLLEQTQHHPKIKTLLARIAQSIHHFEAELMLQQKIVEFLQLKYQQQLILE